MGPVISDLLPLAIGVAISPVPMIAVILMLLAPRAGGTSVGFLVGWVLGIVVVTVVALLLAGTADLGSSSEPSALASWIKLALGAALLLLGIHQLRSGPAPGEEAALPKWMSAIETFTPAKATGLGFLLSALNPKNLAMCLAAGVTIAAGGLADGETVLAVAIFVVLAASTVAVPVVAYLIASARMAGPLQRLKVWLQQHNAAIMGILLLVLGTVLVGKGLGGLL
jgi:threonine/homoserine/homoserine lactone efflux protein